MSKMYCWIFFIIFTVELLMPTKCDEHFLTCKERSSVSFECPCSGQTNYCRFKKLFQVGYIVRDGVLSIHQQQHLSYEFNENKTHVTLKECHKDDEGTYVWMCGGSDVNRHFHLEFVKFSDENLTCTENEKISFLCPCAKELDSCRFKKVSQEGDHFIVKDGVLNVQNIKYELDENRTRVTLKECTKNDEGTYIWTCDKCKFHKQFYLEIIKVSDELVQCSENGKISFVRPCAEVSQSCSFKKVSQKGDHFIVKDGILNVQDVKYELNEKGTQVTLKECSDDDNGTYIWTCEKCKLIRQFHLEMQGLKQLETGSKTSQLLLYAPLCIIVPFLFLTFVRRKQGNESTQPLLHLLIK